MALSAKDVARRTAKRKGLPMVKFQIPEDAVTPNGQPGLSATGLLFKPGAIVETADRHLIRALVSKRAKVLEGNAHCEPPSVRELQSQGYSEEDAVALRAYEECALSGGDENACKAAQLEARTGYRRDRQQRAQRMAELASTPIPTVEELVEKGAEEPFAYAQIAYISALKRGASEAEADKLARAELEKRKPQQAAERARVKVPTVEELVARGYDTQSAVGKSAQIGAIAAGKSEAESVEIGARAVEEWRAAHSPTPAPEALQPPPVIVPPIEPPPVAQPPVDNDHVAPGAEPFSEATIAANAPAPTGLLDDQGHDAGAAAPETTPPPAEVTPNVDARNAGSGEGEAGHPDRGHKSGQRRSGGSRRR